MNLITATVADLRKNLEHYLNRVVDGNDKLIVPRKDSKGVIFISLCEYNDLVARCSNSESQIGK
jgi:PHD/YefM family antitoxin component YafN of YafNO toxin-antitoxin module